ncbi:hypothetical protein MTO96_046413, partial [Rhipicephalus appendiculatus]
FICPVRIRTVFQWFAIQICPAPVIALPIRNADLVANAFTRQEVMARQITEKCIAQPFD